MDEKDRGDISTAMLLDYGADFRLQSTVDRCMTDCTPTGLRLLLEHGASAYGYDQHGNSMLSQAQSVNRRRSRQQQLAKASMLLFYGGGADAAQRKLHHRLRRAAWP
eukprot:PLAT11312.1.p1 GENE.PLAT11312.1~~PLAT11312.1.p1  ORF type:complete len:107 (+),score=5.02 PLAT11312.1:151-471(+)